MLSDSSRDVAKQAKRKYDARDLGKGAVTGNEGERGSTAYLSPSSRAISQQFLRSLHILVLEPGTG